VRVITPADRGSLFCNNYFSVALLGLCGSNYQFTFVDIGSYGRSDSSTFKNSLLCKKHKQIFSTFHQGVLAGTDGPTLTNVLIGDEAFKLTINLLHPFVGKHLSKKKMFNHSLYPSR
jgi:hypothetical protein